MQRTPAISGFQMPAEWAPHAGCYISWPVKEETWFGFIGEARRAYSEVIKAIHRFEPVTVLSDPSTARGARAAVGPGPEIVEMPLDDAWIRDNGPIFVRNEEGEVAAVRFGFNGWGGRFPPYEKDAQVPLSLARMLGMKCYEAPMVLEGGSICVDGEGTLLTTESCLLSKNRNPQLSKEGIEEVLRSYLGVKKVLWLKTGIHKSMIDGHVDGVAAFARSSTVILAHTDDETNPNYLGMKENKERLSTYTDAKGRPIEVIDFPMPDHTELAGNRIAACYPNFYFTNGGIVVPIFGEEKDKAVIEILESLFPSTEVVGVRSEHIAIGGGDVHCITQQIPDGTPAPSNPD